MRYPMRPEEPLTPEQQKASQIMKTYNSSGDYKKGWQPSAPMSAQRGMMGAAARTGGAISRGASNAGGAISRGFGSDVGGFGKLFA